MFHLHRPWSLQLETYRGSGVDYECNLNPFPQTSNMVLSLKRVDSGGCGSASINASSVVDASVGKTYLLQGMHDGAKYTCRLLATSGALLSSASLLPKKGGHVQVETKKRALEVHHARIFLAP